MSCQCTEDEIDWSGPDWSKPAVGPRRVPEAWRLCSPGAGCLWLLMSSVGQSPRSSRSGRFERVSPQPNRQVQVSSLDPYSLSLFCALRLGPRPDQLELGVNRELEEEKKSNDRAKSHPGDRERR